MKSKNYDLAKVIALDPAETTFSDMLAGWDTMQLARGFTRSTRRRNAREVVRFKNFLNEFPWNWSPNDVEAYTGYLMSRGPAPLAPSTIRGYHYAIRSFCEYLTNPHYPWIERCEELFGTIPAQICFEWNTVRHLAQFEGRPQRRPFSYTELQRLFDTADDRIEEARGRGVKGSLEAYRDSQLFKTVYAFGLRRTEAQMLDIHDLRPNVKAPQWGTYGLIHVRFAKSNKGGQPRRRTVLALPEFEWAIAGLRDWVENVRPLYGCDDSPYLWPTERRNRISARALNDRFGELRSDADIDPALTLHSLRHSYVTHLIEHGYSERFVQEQVGHSYSATTAIYTSVSDDFRNRTLEQALARITGRNQGRTP